MKKFIKFLVGLVLLLVLAVLLVLLFWLGPVVKKAVETVGPEALGTEVTVEEVSIKPLSGTAEISGLFVGNPEGFVSPSAIEVDSFKANLQLSSLMGDTLVIEKLHLDGAVLTYEKKRGTDNIQELMKNAEAFSHKFGAGGGEEQPEGETAGKTVIIEHLLVTGGKVRAKVGSLPTATFVLPTIERHHIGGESEGTSFGEATKEVLTSLRDGSLQALKDGVKVAGDTLKQGVDAASEAGKEAGDKAKKAVEGLGDLFRKKE